MSELVPTVRRLPPWWRAGAACLLLVWATVLTLVIAIFMAGHWSTLPAPDPRDRTLAVEVSALRVRPGWLAVHVLAVDCRCSQRVLDHIITSRRPIGLSEVVVLVGDDPLLRDKATRAGLAVRVMTPAALERDLHVVAAPLFVVAGPDNAIRYAGGYTTRKQSSIEDVEIATELMAGERQGRLPIYGCGVSESLRRALDPLGVKYR